MATRMSLMYVSSCKRWQPIIFWRRLTLIYKPLPYTDSQLSTPSSINDRFFPGRMSLSRAATRGLLQWTKKTEQSLLRSSGPSQPNRTYSTTIATSSPARQRTCSRILRATKYSPLALVHHGHASVAQRTFSASPAVSHNHLEAPKPGEEYAQSNQHSVDCTNRTQVAYYIY
jgi:hypothetical protein